MRMPFGRQGNDAGTRTQLITCDQRASKRVCKKLKQTLQLERPQLREILYCCSWLKKTKQSADSELIPLARLVANLHARCRRRHRALGRFRRLCDESHLRD